MPELTRFEEQILLSVWKLQDKAYGITNKDLAIGGIYFPPAAVKAKDTIV